MSPDEKLREILAQADERPFGNPRAAARWIARAFAKAMLEEALRSAQRRISLGDDRHLILTDIRALAAKLDGEKP